MTTSIRHLIGARAAFVMQLIVALVLCATATQLLQAKPGDLDASFGSNGHVRYTFSQQELALPEGPVARGAGIAQQLDGKLVAGLSLGQVIADGVYVLFDSQQQDLAVVRFNVDGSPDLSFNAVGRAGPDFPGIAATTNSVLLQPDGKIVAAGEGIVLGPAANVGRIALARYNPDGSPDTAFANGGAGVFDTGWQITQLPYSSVPIHVLQQGDGRLVVGATSLSVSTTSPPWPARMALARFTAAGSLDATFGLNGSVVLTSSGGSSDEAISGIAQQSDGKLIAVGTTASGATRAFLVVRLTPSGAVDRSFGVDGRAIVSFGGGTSVASSGETAIQLDGRILLVGIVGDASLGQAWCPRDADAAVVRLNSDGGLDATFGDGGKARFSVSACDSAESIALAPDGSIYIGGVASALSDNTGWLRDPYVARLTSSGHLDPAYGNGGISLVDLGTWMSSSDATDAHLIRQDDGRIVIVADQDGVQQMITRLLETGSYPGALGFSSMLQNVSASATSVSIAVRRMSGSSGVVRVGYATHASSYMTPSDALLGISGTLSWANGDTADKSIVIAMPAGVASRGPEGVALTLTNPSGGASLSDGEIEVQVLAKASAGTIQGGGSTSGGGGGLGCELFMLLALTLLPLIRRFRADLRHGLLETSAAVSTLVSNPASLRGQLPALTVTRKSAKCLYWTLLG
jgi:uncharacterized delta-60 repeat protein